MPGLNATLACLAETANEAAVEVLLRAVDVPQRNVRDGALRALLLRRSLAAEQALLARWHLLSDHLRQLIAEKRGWISGAIRQAVLGSDSQLHSNACAAAIVTRDFDLIPLFCEVTCDSANRWGASTAACVLRLAEELHDLIQSPRDYRERRDPAQVRAFVLPPLERSLIKAPAEHQTALTEAFLLLAGREHAGLKRLMEQSDQSLPQRVLKILETSSRRGILHYLVSCLDDPFLPAAVRDIYCRRTDVPFLRKLFQRVGSNPGKNVRNNLRRMASCAWLQKGLGALDALTDGEQAGAVTWIALSGVDREQAEEVVAHLVRHGGAVARRTAASLLAEFKSPMADELAFLAAHDQDAEVRAVVAPQLRQRKVAGGIQRLLEMVDSPFEPERDAARQALEEFRYDHFADVFESLPASVRTTTGLLVKRIDPQALQRVSADLRSPQRQRRQKALELVCAMEAVAELHRDVSQLLADEDEFIRASAVRALAGCKLAESRMALREKLTDASPLVRQAAEEGLRIMRAEESSEPTFVPALEKVDLLADYSPNPQSY